MAVAKEPDVLYLDDEVWEQVVSATGGAAAPCFQCGTCTAICPWGLVRPEPVSVRRLIREAQLGLYGTAESLWLCTTCGACELGCPKGVPISDVIIALRSLRWPHGNDRPAERPPKGVASVLWALHWDGNPWRQPPSRREGWAKGVAAEPFDPATHELLFYVGCTASYDQRAQKIARALAGVLTAAGVRFGTLGEMEPCCGDAAHALGQQAYLDEMIDKNARLFEEAGVGTLVTTSPHCYDMFSRHYPDLNGRFRPLHYTEYLQGLLAEGRLRFGAPLPMRVTYHDPCYLGRRHGVYEAPRQILEAIPGLELLEMAENREQALCCGGGGGRMWMETEAGQRFSDIRARQVAETGATHVVTACPFCISCLEDSLGSLSPGVKVLDVAEVAWQALRVEGRP